MKEEDAGSCGDSEVPVIAHVERSASDAPVAHTPGPWHIKRGTSCLHVVSADDSMHTGCIDFAGNGAANARLIAAAPDLYEAMSGAMQWLEETLSPCDDGCECLLHSFRAALAKAEGRS